MSIMTITNELIVFSCLTGNTNARRPRRRLAPAHRRRRRRAEAWRPAAAAWQKRRRRGTLGWRPMYALGPCAVDELYYSRVRLQWNSRHCVIQIRPFDISIGHTTLNTVWTKLLKTDAVWTDYVVFLCVNRHCSVTVPLFFFIKPYNQHLERLDLVARSWHH